MRIVIVHHHLNPGGVTRIIQSQVRSLRMMRSPPEITLLVGDSGKLRAADFPGLDLAVNPDLTYLATDTMPKAAATALLGRIVECVKATAGKNDILHVHNLNLGKNPVMTLAFSRLAAEGYRLFNHCHDFAEDRPANLAALRHTVERMFGDKLPAVLYPPCATYRYGVLNTCDFSRLLETGIHRSRVSLLPNPVDMPRRPGLSRDAARAEICRELAIDPSRRIITYPVRVIRRKNIGELILLAALFSGRATWLVTQPPKNPAEMDAYARWKQFCTDRRLDLVFEAGTRADFETILFASDVCITTSTREGFGMVYLEPWLFGTPVMGRNLPMVTEDLIRSGISFPMLYDRLRMPGKSDGDDDFATLAETEQARFIDAIRKDAARRDETSRLNPHLERVFAATPSGITSHNKAIIENTYSLEKYSERLHEIYTRMAGCA